MDSNYLPLWKVLDAPLISLDASHVELFSLLALFMLCLVALVAGRTYRQWVRHAVQMISLAVFFYIVYSCLGVFGMIRNVMHGSTLIGSVFTEAFFWMSLPMVVIAFSVTTGPYFCGWICPTGTFQEALAAGRERLVSWLPSRPRPAGQRPAPWVLALVGLFFSAFVVLVFWLGTTKRFYVEDSSLHWAAGLVLIVFLVMGRWADDEAIRPIRTVSFVIITGSALLKTAIVSPVHFAFADVTDPASALTTLVLVVASLFISRAWCRYICPWGWVMGCVHRVSRLRVEPVGECTGCGTCESACRVGAIRDGRVAIDACQFCMACVDRCPTKTLEVVDVWKRDQPD
jgi:polyferredoxin